MSLPSVKMIPIITRITSKLIRILGCNPGPMTLQGTNTYLVGNGKHRILFDTGESDKPQYINHLKEVLNEENATINNIILSHWHNDHIGGVKDVLKCLDKENVCSIWKFARTDAPDDYPELHSIIVKNLSDGQEFSNDDGLTIRVIHTPGHTTDHCVLMVKETNELFSGDCILGEGTAVFEDLYEYIKSLKHIIDENPTVIYPGHGNIISDPISKIQYYIDHRNQREQQILDVLRSQKDSWYTVIDIVKTIYATTPQNLWLAAARNVNQHLYKLEKEGRIIKKNIIESSNEFVWKYN